MENHFLQYYSPGPRPLHANKIWTKQNKPFWALTKCDHSAAVLHCDAYPV
jgi:DNA-directed RNA polymerase